MEKEVEAVIKILGSKPGFFKKEILAFEGHLPDGVRPWFPQTFESRFYDRAVVILEDHDGASMMELLNQALGLKKEQPGHHQALETMSLARHQNHAWFQQAKKKGRSLDDLQGSLLIHGAFLNQEFSKTFISRFEELKSLSQ